MAYSIERMPERISIGRETETGVTDVMIDCGAWVSKWPGMELHAIHTPDGGAPYILQTETDGSVLVWHVTDADTATPGTGRMEIVGEMDGRRKVSAMVKVYVAARMSGTVGEPPEAAKPWADRVVEAAERITGMQAQAETLDAGSGATAAWDGEQGLLTIGVPKGEQGPKGEKGEKGPQGEKGEPGKDAVVDATLTQSGQAADAKVTGDAVSKLKDDLASEQTAREEADNDLRADLIANANADAETKRSLNALWKLNQGISYDFQTDAAAAYAKQVPSGAKLADVQSVAGKTVVWNQPVQYTSSTSNENGISVTAEGKHVSIVVENPTNHYQVSIGTIKLISGHKYLTLTNKAVESGIEVYFTGNPGIRNGRYSIETPHESYLGNQKVLVFCGVNVANGTYEYDVSVFDLTQLFGSGNEPTDISDSRIAWIEQYAAAHPEYNAGELISADVESVKYNDTVVAAIPEAVRALPGYGWSAGSVANTIERTENGWQYVQRVGSVDLGSLLWTKTSLYFYTFYKTGIRVSTGQKNAICATYTQQRGEEIFNQTVDKAYAINDLYLSPEEQITIRDTAYTDEAELKASLNGVMLYYELAEPIITPITKDMLEAFEVEAGGTITFENAAKLPVPNSIEYIVSLAEVGV